MNSLKELGNALDNELVPGEEDKEAQLFFQFFFSLLFSILLTALNVGMIIYFLTSSYASNPKGLYGSPYPSRINMDF